MLKRKIDNISQTKTKNDRIACIKPSSRHLRSGADVSLYINHTFFAFQAIRWRMNRICIGSICPSCDRKFYFNHADKCLGLTDTDDLFRFSTITALLRRLEAITAAIRPELLPPWGLLWPTSGTRYSSSCSICPRTQVYFSFLFLVCFLFYFSLH